MICNFYSDDFSYEFHIELLILVIDVIEIISQYINFQFIGSACKYETFLIHASGSLLSD